MRLYFRLLAATLRSRMQYKLDFLISTLLYALISTLDFLTVAAILYRYPTVGGWSVFEIALLSGAAGTAYGLFRVFAAELDTFERYLVTGEFDSLLIRPWPTLASLVSRGFDFGRFGACVSGVTLMTIGIKAAVANGAPGWLALYALLLPVAGALVVASLATVTAAVGFWIIRINELFVFTINAPMAAASYPLKIFPGWMRRLFIGVLPIGTVSYFPLTYLLGKGGTPAYLAVPVITAVMTVSVALLCWQWGERWYQSTGS